MFATITDVLLIANWNNPWPVMSRFFPKNQIWAAGVMHPTKLSSAGFILSICCETFNVPPSFAVVKTSIASEQRFPWGLTKQIPCMLCWKPWICWARKHVRLFGKERTFALLCIPSTSLDRPSLGETYIGKIQMRTCKSSIICNSSILFQCFFNHAGFFFFGLSRQG